MKTSSKFAALAASTLLFLTGASPASAALLQMRAYLNGAQVPVASAQTGAGTMTFDTSTKLLSWSVTFTGLTGAFTDAHFHGPAPAGVDGAIVVPMTGSTSPLTGSATLNPTQEAQLLSGQWYINIHSATYPSGEIRGQVRRVQGDLDGNGKADLLWRHETAGTVLGWLMNGTTIGSSGSAATVADAGWQVAGRGDFDGDGKIDLLWTHTDGSVYIWLMNGNAIAGAGSPAGLGLNSGWVVQGVGDFDGDGKADIFWKHIPTGQTYVWLMNGTSIAGAGSPGSVGDLDWQVQGMGDFDGDGRDDVFWTHADGSTYIWLMNGAAIGGTGGPGGLAPNSGWEVRGVGDFDGNGKADILWKHAPSGTVAIWQMNGTAIAGSGSPGSVGAENGWQVMQVGDFDGDGRADIFWRDLATGGTLVWLMNGTAIGSSASQGTIGDLLWTTQGRAANRWASLVGAQNAANALAATINAQGANLAASHIAPMMSTAYLHSGFNASEDAGQFASEFRGLTGTVITVNRLFRFDAVNQAAFVTVSLNATAPGPTPVAQQATEQNGGLGFKRIANGTWKLHGNQWPGEIIVNTEMLTENFTGTPVGPRQHVNVFMRTRKDLYTAVTVSGGGIFSGAVLQKNSATEVVTVQPDPGGPTVTYLRDNWFTGADSALTGLATFAVSVTPTSGPVVTRKVLSNTVTTQVVTITSPTLHTLATANLDSPLAVSWTLPGFAISGVRLNGFVRTSMPPNPGFECQIDDVDFATNATSGQITLPSTCSGQPVVAAGIGVAVDGTGGERTRYTYNFQ